MKNIGGMLSILPLLFNVPRSADSSIYPLCFHILAHSFALTKNSTLLFPNTSALFHKNTRGGGTLRLSRIRLPVRSPASPERRLSGPEPSQILSRGLGLLSQTAEIRPGARRSSLYTLAPCIQKLDATNRCQSFNCFEINSLGGDASARADLEQIWKPTGECGQQFSSLCRFSRAESILLRARFCISEISVGLSVSYGPIFGLA
jgi:hypothetical protein